MKMMWLKILTGFVISLTLCSCLSPENLIPTINTPTVPQDMNGTPAPAANSETEQPSQTPVAAPPTSAILFEDDFSDNRNDWDLTGTTRLSQGKLLVSVTNETAVILFPNLEITVSNFTVQADMTLESQGNCEQSMGFVLGNRDVDYHTFVIINTCDGFGFLHAFDAFYDNQQELFRTEIKENKPDIRRTHKIKLDVIDGIVTLYYDGIPTDSQQISPYGKNPGFFLSNPQNAENVYSFDNLRVIGLP